MENRKISMARVKVYPFIFVKLDRLFSFSRLLHRLKINCGTTLFYVNFTGKSL